MGNKHIPQWSEILIPKNLFQGISKKMFHVFYTKEEKEVSISFYFKK